MNGCPCVREHGVGMYAAPSLWVSLWNAMEKPGLTSCDLGHDVTKGGAQSLRHVHGAPGLWVSLWTAMQKPGLTSCDLGHDVKKGGAQNLRHVHGAVERQACAWSWRPEPYACGRPSLFDAICVVTPRLTWKMSKRKWRWGASSFCAHQVHCSERQQREWQAEEELAASMAWLAAMRSAVVHTAALSCASVVQHPLQKSEGNTDGCLKQKTISVHWLYPHCLKPVRVALPRPIPSNPLKLHSHDASPQNTGSTLTA